MNPDIRLVSNPVFQSLQPPSKKLSDKKSGTIIFANKFSGIAECPMPEDLKEILDSDFATVGNNPLVQLNNKMMAYPGGPWYIDSRNGVLYIHNQKFKEAPVYEYSYQSGNGELLSINFTTQRIKREVSASITQNINPMNKGYYSESAITLDRSLDKFELPTPLISQEVPLDKLRVAKKQFPWQIPFDDTLSKEESQAYQVYKSGDLKSYNNKAATKSFLDMGNEELARHADTYLNSRFPTQGQREQFRKDAAEAKKRGNLEQFWKATFQGDTYIVNEGNDTWAEEWVNPYYYDTYGKLEDPYLFSGNGVLYTGAIDQDLKSAIKKLDSLPYIKVIDNSLVVKNTGDRPSSINCKVRVLRKRKRSYSLSGYRLIRHASHRLGNTLSSTDDSTRSSSKGLSGNSLSNLNGKTVERKLVVQALVVGNPILESSQIIMINNVGSKWTGPYYIKSCSHKLTAGEGYTCSLELIQNSSKAGSNTVSTSVPTKKGNNHPDSKVPDKINITPTQTELDWFAAQTTVEAKVDVVMKAMYARYSAKDSAELDKINQEGVVKSSGTYNSSGKYEVKYTLRKPIKVSFEFKHTYYQTVKDYISSREKDNSK